jgi:hypothetical protein
LVKKPSLRAIRAGACVMLLRNPSRTVTDERAAAPEVPVDPEDDDEEEEQPASSRAAPITAALVTRRIQYLISIVYIGNSPIHYT